MSNEDLQSELDKAQIMLGFVLNEVGDVTISPTKSLPAGASIEVVQNEDGTLTLKLVVDGD